MLGIHAAVNRAVPQCAVSVEQAIEMYTVNGAYALFEDKRKGKAGAGIPGGYRGAGPRHPRRARRAAGADRRDRDHQVRVGAAQPAVR